MKQWRNIIMIIGFFGFCIWYGGTWAYRTRYKEPRENLLKQIKEITNNNQYVQNSIEQQKMIVQNLQVRNLPARSLPRPLVRAENLYQTWLLELTQFCHFEEATVEKQGMRREATYYVLPYQVTARTTIDQLSRFMYEFYWARYVHRITRVNIAPVENASLVDVTLLIEGIAIPPLSPNDKYPLVDQLPQGYWPRLSSGLLETYLEPIDARNLLQFTRGGIDAADHTKLTGIVYTNGKPEIWLTNHVTGHVERPRIGEQIRIGSFLGTPVEIFDQDVVFVTPASSTRPAMRWLISTGENLTEAMALPTEY